jgi:hypothetical protein
VNVFLYVLMELSSKKEFVSNAHLTAKLAQDLADTARLAMMAPL